MGMIISLAEILHVVALWPKSSDRVPMDISILFCSNAVILIQRISEQRVIQM